MSDEEAFVQELDFMSDVNDIPVDNGLAEPNVWSASQVTDTIVINRSANLQTWDGVGACKQSDINMIAVVLVYESIVVELGTNSIARSALRNIVQRQSPR